MKRNVLFFSFVLPACSAVAGGGPITINGDVPVADGAVVGGFDTGFPVDAGFAMDAGFAIDVGFAVDRGFPVDHGFDVPVRVDTGPPATRTGVVAGRHCTDDTACATDAVDLSCVPTNGGSICTTPSGCDQGTVAEEESACGGRYSTCLVYGNLTDGTQVSLCSRACVATASTEAAGARPAGSICTTNWLQLASGQTEAAGCLPFCASDADCAGVTAGDASVMRCNTRLGRCAAAPFNPALLPDGSLCNPMTASAGTAQCRGTCFSLSSAHPTQGLCGSFINEKVTQTCADDAAVEVRGVSGDNLGLCIFKTCSTNADCTGGAVCVYPEDTTTSPASVRTDLPSSCGYASTLQPSGIPSP